MQPRDASNNRRCRRETDLAAPVRGFLAAQGFVVRSEVHGCDVTGVKGEHVVVVELKLTFSLDLLLQAVRRQALADFVYVAVPRPTRDSFWKRLREARPLLRRLEMGLLVVDFRDEPPSLEVVVQPLPFQRRRKPAARAALLREITLRSGDDNTGGSNRRPLVTAYRENALHIAALLAREGSMQPRQLRALGTGAKTLSILRDNVYGWFERINRGVYALKPAGAAALHTYADVVRRLEPKLNPQLADAT